LLPGDRNSVEPMAARVHPGRVQAAHQSLHHVVAKADWSDDTVLAAVRARVLPIIERRGAAALRATRQAGQLPQVAVSLSAANDHASLPIAYRLCLPHEWADDPRRRAEAGVPDDVVFQTKPQIALDQVRSALVAGIDAEVVLADAGYGNGTDLRDGRGRNGPRWTPVSANLVPTCGIEPRTS
jgi:SRSO17 transposase